MGYSSGTIGRASYPGKLGTEYSPVGLWLFDGGLTDSGSAGESLSLARGAAQYAYVVDGARQSLVIDDPDGYAGASSPAPAALRVTGDVTVQIVFTPLENATGLYGSVLVSCDGQAGTAAANECYLLLYDGAVGGSPQLEPMFRWEHSTGTRVTIKASPAHYLTPGQPVHLVGRRWDAGASSYTGQLWANGVLLAETTGATGPSGGTSSFMNIGRQASGNVAVQNSLYHCIKVVDRKLTDAELLDEFLRTGTATELS